MEQKSKKYERGFWFFFFLEGMFQVSLKETYVEYKVNFALT